MSMLQGLGSIRALFAVTLVVGACAPQNATSAPSASAAVASCPDDGKPIRVGVFMSLTGPGAFNGVPDANGIKMKAEQINASGGIGGRQIALDMFDERGDPKEATNVARLITSNDQTLAAIGATASTQSLAAKPVFTDAKIVMIAPASSHPDLTTGTRYVFRAINQQVQLANPYAAFLVDRLKAKKIAMIVGTDDFSKSNAEQVLKVLKDKYPAVQVVLQETVPPDATDFRTLLTKLQTAGPDLLYMIPQRPQEGSVFLKQLAQSGQKYKLVGGSSGLYSQVFLDLVGPAGEGVYVTSFFDPSDARPAAKDFVARYKAKYGQDADQWAAFGDDTMSLLSLAMKSIVDAKKCISREGIADALRALPAYDGLTGRKKFTPSGDIETAAPAFLVVEKGKYRVLAANEP